MIKEFSANDSTIIRSLSLIPTRGCQSCLGCLGRRNRELPHDFSLIPSFIRNVRLHNFTQITQLTMRAGGWV